MDAQGCHELSKCSFSLSVGTGFQEKDLCVHHSHSAGAEHGLCEQHPGSHRHLARDKQKQLWENTRLLRMVAGQISPITFSFT